MSDTFNLRRFVLAQDTMFQSALLELSAGYKQSHWMWFIFPQLAGLGRSPASQFYGLRSIEEARAYLDHQLLGPRLRQCVKVLLPWAQTRDAEQILGALDALKLKSCLTLFDRAEPRDSFDQALKSFFDGQSDERTLALLNAPA